MLFSSRTLSAVFTTCALSLPFAAQAQSTPSLEAGLVDAMRLSNKESRERGNSGKAIQAYMREGLVNPRPNKRSDYTDYYVLKGPTKFLGHDLVSIEEEYLTKFIGCCVNPGVGVVVKPVGSAANMEKFAKANSCTLTPNFDLVSHLRDVGVSEAVPAGNYLSMSCRANDITR